MKHRTAVILTVIFTLFIVSPTIISVVEKNFDVSILFNMSEEENNHKEIAKNFDLKYSEQKNNLSFFTLSKKAAFFDYYVNDYTDIYQENKNPPPEFL